MQLLNLKPSATVGKALDFLLELRLERGPLGEEDCDKRVTCLVGEIFQVAITVLQ
jgi:hypothetical protein